MGHYLTFVRSVFLLSFSPIGSALKSAFYFTSCLSESIYCPFLFFFPPISPCTSCFYHYSFHISLASDRTRCHTLMKRKCKNRNNENTATRTEPTDPLACMKGGRRGGKLDPHSHTALLVTSPHVSPRHVTRSYYSSIIIILRRHRGSRGDYSLTAKRGWRAAKTTLKELSSKTQNDELPLRSSCQLFFLFPLLSA